MAKLSSVISNSGSDEAGGGERAGEDVVGVIEIEDGGRAEGGLGDAADGAVGEGGGVERGDFALGGGARVALVMGTPLTV